MCWSASHRLRTPMICSQLGSSSCIVFRLGQIVCCVWLNPRQSPSAPGPTTMASGSVCAFCTSVRTCHLTPGAQRICPCQLGRLFAHDAMDLAYMCVEPQMRFLCVKRCPSKTPNAFICVSPNAFMCVSPNAFICVSPNAFICVSPNAFLCVSPNASADTTELTSLAYLCSLHSHVF